MNRKIRTLLLIAPLIAILALALVPVGETFAQSSSGTCTRTHIVQRGENLFRIGLLYGVRWDVLQQWNNLANPNVIYAGQVLCVSGPAVTNPPTQPGTGGPIVVRPGNPFSPTTDPRVWFPSITLGTQFELKGYNFPANTQVTISMKVLGGAVYTPYYTAQTDSRGEFYVLVTIPTELRASGTVAVDARTTSGFFARNWFYNR